MGAVPLSVNCDRRWSVAGRSFHCVNIAIDLLVIATVPSLCPDLGKVTGEDVRMWRLSVDYSWARLAAKVVAYAVRTDVIWVFLRPRLWIVSPQCLHFFNGQFYGR